MARKKDKIDNDLEGGSLSHNPFASLLGGTAGGAGSAKAPAPERKAKQTPAAKPDHGAQKIVVRFEAKGHGGKTVTRISGLADQAEDLAALAARLKKAMGTGARVADGEVLVQGKLVDRVVVWLQKNGHKHVVRGN